MPELAPPGFVPVRLESAADFPVALGPETSGSLDRALAGIAAGRDALDALRGQVLGTLGVVARLGGVLPVEAHGRGTIMGRGIRHGELS